MVCIVSMPRNELKDPAENRAIQKKKLFGQVGVNIRPESTRLTILKPSGIWILPLPITFVQEVKFDDCFVVCGSDR